MQETIETLGILFTALGVLGTLAGVRLIARQIKLSQRFARGEFIRALEQEFREYKGVYEKIAHTNEAEAASRRGIKDDEIPSYCLYLAFFEKLAYLNLLGLLELDEISRLFSYRFFAVTNNPSVQEKILCKADIGQYFPSVFELHKKLSEYRRTNGKPIPFIEHHLPEKQLHE